MTKVPTLFQKTDRAGFFANIGKGGKPKRVRLGDTLEEATIALGKLLEAPPSWPGWRGAVHKPDW